MGYYTYEVDNTTGKTKATYHSETNRELEAADRAIQQQLSEERSTSELTTMIAEAKEAGAKTVKITPVEGGASIIYAGEEKVSDTTSKPIELPPAPERPSILDSNQIIPASYPSEYVAGIKTRQALAVQEASQEYTTKVLDYYSKVKTKLATVKESLPRDQYYDANLKSIEESEREISKGETSAQFNLIRTEKSLPLIREQISVLGTTIAKREAIAQEKNPLKKATLEARQTYETNENYGPKMLFKDSSDLLGGLGANQFRLPYRGDLDDKPLTDFVGVNPYRLAYAGGVGVQSLFETYGRAGGEGLGAAYEFVYTSGQAAFKEVIGVESTLLPKPVSKEFAGEAGIIGLKVGVALAGGLPAAAFVDAVDVARQPTPFRAALVFGTQIAFASLIDYGVTKYQQGKINSHSDAVDDLFKGDDYQITAYRKVPQKTYAEDVYETVISKKVGGSSYRAKGLTIISDVDYPTTVSVGGQPVNVGSNQFTSVFKGEGVVNLQFKPSGLYRGGSATTTIPLRGGASGFISDTGDDAVLMAVAEFDNVPVPYKQGFTDTFKVSKFSGQSYSVQDLGVTSVSYEGRSYVSDLTGKSFAKGVTGGEQPFFNFELPAVEYVDEFIPDKVISMSGNVIKTTDDVLFMQRGFSESLADGKDLFKQVSVADPLVKASEKALSYGSGVRAVEVEGTDVVQALFDSKLLQSYEPGKTLVKASMAPPISGQALINQLKTSMMPPTLVYSPGTQLATAVSGLTTMGLGKTMMEPLLTKTVTEPLITLSVTKLPTLTEPVVTVKSVKLVTKVKAVDLLFKGVNDTVVLTKATAIVEPVTITKTVAKTITNVITEPITTITAKTVTTSAPLITGLQSLGKAGSSLLGVAAFPSFGGGSGYKKAKYKRVIQPKLGYTPDLASVFFGRKTTNKKVRSQRVFTPFTPRPIIITKIKKISKKKVKKSKRSFNLFKLPKYKPMRLKL